MDKKPMTKSDFNLLDMKLANINSRKKNLQAISDADLRRIAMDNLRNAIGSLNEWLGGFG